MRVPVGWLNTLVETDVSTDELAHRLTLAGIELEGREPLPPEGLDWAHHVVGHVERVEAHPNADRLAVAHVDIGGETRQIVHGAPNLPVGASDERVAVALEGARIAHAYDPDAAYLEVGRVELRGVESQGVICSEYELGLSEHHEGVLLLDSDAPVGTPLREHLGDEVLEFELTPNLGRCLAMVGMAREAAALAEGTLHVAEPDWTPEGPPASELARVTIDDPELCPRYTASVIRDLDPSARTPFWMRYRLLQCGVRPIHPIVDITNYVMLEWGQPLHAFDYDKLCERASGATPRITVRPAATGERLTTLDGQTRELSDDMLVIADEVGPIALAGVMGGAETEVTSETRNVLLESASFHAIRTRRTSQTLALPSESAHRFARGVPAPLAERGARRAAELMRTIAGGTIADGLVDAYPSPPEPTVISLDAGDVRRLLGMDLADAEIVEALETLDFDVELAQGTLNVGVPYYRLDVGIPADLVEEVARRVGYDRLPSTRLRDALPPQRRHPELEGEERVRDLLAGCGLTEVISYRLTSPESTAKLDPERDPSTADGSAFVTLANPISSERSHMRRTLVNGLLETVASNQRHRERIALYEVGRVYLPRADRTLPDEPRRVGLAMAGPRNPASWARSAEPVDVFDLKGVVETLLAHLHIPDAQFVATEHEGSLHPGRAAELRVSGETIGTLGEVHPTVAERFEIAGRAYVAELDLDRLLAHQRELSAYAPIPRYPGIHQDLALIVDEATPADRVAGLIREAGGQLLREVRLFDVYTGEPIPEGQRSLAFTLWYQASDRTLTDEEAQAVHERIQRTLERELGAQVRGLGAS